MRGMWCRDDEYNFSLKNDIAILGCVSLEYSFFKNFDKFDSLKKF